MTVELTTELENQICDKIAEGLSLRAACLTLDCSPSSFIRHANENKALAEHYAQSINMRTELMAEDILDITDDVIPMTEHGYDGAAVQNKRVRIDTRKWLLSKMMPKKYGDKLDVTSDGEKIAAMLPVFPQKKVEGSDVG
jgi:hypothetical protein